MRVNKTVKRIFSDFKEYKNIGRTCLLKDLVLYKSRDPWDYIYFTIVGRKGTRLIIQPSYVSGSQEKMYLVDKSKVKII